MTEDFKARVARLEAKGAGPDLSSNHAQETPKNLRNSGPSRDVRSGPSMTKMILVAIACLILLPVGATFATLYLL